MQDKLPIIGLLGSAGTFTLGQVSDLLGSLLAITTLCYVVWKWRQTYLAKKCLRSGCPNRVVTPDELEPKL